MIDPAEALSFSLPTTLPHALELCEFVSHPGITSKVKSEKIPSFPGLEEAEPTCAVALLPHEGWIGCRVRFPQGWMQKDTRSPEVLSFFFFFLLAKYLDGAKISSEFNSYTVACDTQVL